MKTVLLTGATGAIGSALAELFLRENDTAVRLVLRARSKEHLQERVKDLLEFWGFDQADPSVSGRLEVFRGDVSRPLLGLDEASYGRLVREVTHLVHSAGNVKLNQSLDEARRSAVDSARHAVAFAAACPPGRFRKLDFVSTVGVAGRLRGLIPERPLLEPRAFHNTYEAAKAEAEAFLLERMHQGLPATIHRPSMVVGDSRTGKIVHFQVFYHLSEFLSGKRTLGIVPDAGPMALDIVPVDYVARAIQIASHRDDAIGRIFHLCSGPAHAIPINELAERLRKIFGGYGDRTYHLRRVPSTWLQAAVPLIGRIVPPGARRAVESLPFFLAYLEDPQWFDTSQTRQFFAREGLEVAPPAQYLERLIEYHRRSRPRLRAEMVPA